MDVRGQLHGWTALPQPNTSGIPSIGDFVDPTAGLDALEIETSLGTGRHQPTIPRSSSPQPRQYTNYPIPAARLASCVNIKLYFLLDQLPAVIPVPYCDSEAQRRIVWMGCEVSAIFLSPRDNATELRNVGAWPLRGRNYQISCNATSRYTGVAGFHYFYTHPYVVMAFLFKYGGTLKSQ
jgi:hypothetical protein